MWNRWLLISAVVCSLQCVVGAEEFCVAPFYNDYTILQMAPKRSQIWGYGSERFAEVVLTLNGQNYYSSVRYNWTWSIQLPPHPAGGPYNITIIQNSLTGSTYSSPISFNIMFGDVWLCAGEQNMDFPLSLAWNSTEIINRTYEYTNRIKIGKVEAYMDGQAIFWRPLNKNSVPDFSAVCLMYGMALADVLDDGRPIGLIQATMPGTPIESWVSPNTILQCRTPPSLSTYPDASSNNAQWNKLILPITNISIRGMVWSQGESNLDYNPELYICHLNNFMNEVNSLFFDATVPVIHENNIAFPFGVIQAGPMNSKRPDVWGNLRWSQSFGNGIIQPGPITAFLVTTYDLTDESSTYRKALYGDKQTVATRVANSVTNLLYNHSHALNGPYATSASRGESGVVVLTFDRNVSIVGNQGFQYRVASGEWKPASKFLMLSPQRLGVAVPAEADTLAYAWSATVCSKYRNCAIYSDDEDALPAMPWLWRLSDSENDLQVIIN